MRRYVIVCIAAFVITVAVGMLILFLLRPERGAAAHIPPPAVSGSAIMANAAFDDR